MNGSGGPGHGAGAGAGDNSGGVTAHGMNARCAGLHHNNAHSPGRVVRPYSGGIAA